MLKGAIGFLIIIILFGVIYNNVHKQKEIATISQSHSKSTHVIAEIVKYDDISTYDNTIGIAHGVQSANIIAPVKGAISKFNLKNGMFVRCNEVIISFDSHDDYIKLNIAKTKYDNSKKNIIRFEKLLMSNNISRQLYDEEKSKLKILELEIEKFKDKINRKSVRAPFNGIISGIKFQERKEVIEGQELFHIDDISHIKLSFSIPHKYSLLENDITVKASSNSIPGKIFYGKIDNIDARIDSKTHSIQVESLIKNEAFEIKPGLPMKIKLLFTPKKSIFISEESLVTDQLNYYVYVINLTDSKVYTREVKLGMRKFGLIEIVSGLSENEVIVKRGSINLNNATEVIIDNKDQITLIEKYVQ